MRYVILTLICLLSLAGFAQNVRVNTLTITTGATNNGGYKHVTGAGAGLIFTSDADGDASWLPVPVSMGDLIWTNNTSANSSVIYPILYPTNFQIRALATNGAVLTLGPYTTNWFDTAFGDPKEYYSLLSARDTSRGDEHRNNFWFSAGMEPGGNIYGSIDGSARTNYSILTAEAVGAPGGGLRRVQIGYDGSATIVDLRGTNNSIFSVFDGFMLISGGITNNGSYQHTNAAFTGAIFLSSTTNGDAIWSTNIPTVVITNLYATNITSFTTTISNAFINQAFITNLFVTNLIVNGNSVEGSLWTNDTAVLRPKQPLATTPLFALRNGTLSNSLTFPFGTRYWDQTNVGRWSFASGSNVMARGDGSTALGGNNIVQTNSHYSSIVGGSNNIITSGSVNCLIGSGTSNTIGIDCVGTILLGGRINSIGTLIDYGVLLNGTDQFLSADYGFVGTGAGNNVMSGADYGIIVGGLNNTVRDDKSIIVGGETNSIRGNYGFLGGGRGNIIHGAVGESDQSAIVGGNANVIGAASTFGSFDTFIGGGFFNRILQDSDRSAIVGGSENFIGANITNCFIGGGFNNAIADNALAATIGGGYKNLIANAGDLGFIPGGTSNQVAGAMSATIGNWLTNSVANSVDIGNNDLFKTTFYTQGTLFRTNVTNNASVTFNSHMIGTGSTTSLTADNQSVTVTNRSYIRLSSDSGVATDRTFVLSSGVQDGQLLDLEWVGTNAGELVDDFAATGGGNGRLSATWTPTQYDVLSLRWNGTDWIERSRSAN